MTRSWISPSMVVGLVAVCGAQLSQMHNTPRNEPLYILAQSGPYLIGEEEVIAENVAQVTPSPDGQYLIVTIVPNMAKAVAQPLDVKPEMEWAVYSVANKSLRRVPPSLSIVHLYPIAWPGVALAVTLTKGSRGEMLRKEWLFDLATGAMKPMPEVFETRSSVTTEGDTGLPEYSYVQFSPYDPIAIVFKQDQRGGQVTFHRPDGRLIPNLPVLTNVEFASFSRPGFIRVGRPRNEVVELNLATGQMGPPADLPPEEPIYDHIQLYPSSAEVSFQGKTEKTVGLWADAVLATRSEARLPFFKGELTPVNVAKEDIPDTVAFLGFDLTEVMVSPGPSGIFYQRGSTLIRRSVSKARMDEFDRLRVARARDEAMQIGKQVGIAMLIYCVDYDDNFPLAGTNWQDALIPYIKNRDMLGRFDLVFPGGPFPKEGEITKIVMGYVHTRFGRAVVYMDTSVKWEPKP